MPDFVIRWKHSGPGRAGVQDPEGWGWHAQVEAADELDAISRFEYPEVIGSALKPDDPRREIVLEPVYATVERDSQWDVGERTLVKLWGIREPILIAEAPTGVVYTNQVGGIACSHPTLEGFLVPLAVNKAIKDSKYFDPGWWYDVQLGMARPHSQEEWEWSRRNLPPDKADEIYGRSLEEHNARIHDRYVTNKILGEKTPKKYLASKRRVKQLEAWLAEPRMAEEAIWAEIEKLICNHYPSFRVRLNPPREWEEYEWTLQGERLTGRYDKNQGQRSQEAWVYSDFEVDGRPYHGVLTWENCD